MMRLLAELQRRKVYRVAAGYAVVAWLLIQIATQVFPFFEIPNWGVRLTVLLILLGFPVAVSMAWAFDMTPQGVELTAAQPADGSDANSPSPQSRWAVWMVWLVLSLAIVTAYFLIVRASASRSSAMAGATVAAARDGMDVDPSLIGDKSIAVLPFLDRSEKKDQEYFGDGMSEQILSTLGKIRHLRVAARTTSFAFKNTAMDVREIGRKIGVSTLLEGSVRRDGNRIRITATLVSAANGSELWTETYDRTVDDLFAVQDEISGHIIDALKIKLAIAIPARIPIDSEAYDLYLQGVFYSNKSAEADLRKGLDFFERSLRREPNNAQAWDGIAKVWLWLADAYVKPLDAYPASKAAALKANALDPDDADAHIYLGESLRVLDRDVAGSEAQFRRALELAPSSATAHMFLALLLTAQGYQAEGIEHIHQALKLDSLSPIISSIATVIYLADGRYDDTVEESMRLHGIDSRFQYLGSSLASAYREQGRYAEAVAAYKQAEELTGVPDSGLAITYARMRRTDDARRILAKLETMAQQAYVPADQIAAIHVALGEKDEAFHWLERAFDEHSAPLHGIGIAPEFRALHDDPRFADLLKRLGLDPKRVLSAHPPGSAGIDRSVRAMLASVLV